MKFLSARRHLVGLLAVGLLVGCHPGTHLTKANVDQVSEGMAKKQVESVLGMPTIVDTKDFLAMKKTTYVYRQGKQTVTIVFKEDRVQSKDSTLTD